MFVQSADTYMIRQPVTQTAGSHQEQRLRTSLLIGSAHFAV